MERKTMVCWVASIVAVLIIASVSIIENAKFYEKALVALTTTPAAETAPAPAVVPTTAPPETAPIVKAVPTEIPAETTTNNVAIDYDESLQGRITVYNGRRFYHFRNVVDIVDRDPAGLLPGEDVIAIVAEWKTDEVKNTAIFADGHVEELSSKFLSLPRGSNVTYGVGGKNYPVSIEGEKYVIHAGEIICYACGVWIYKDFLYYHDGHRFWRINPSNEESEICEGQPIFREGEIEVIVPTTPQIYEITTEKESYQPSSGSTGTPTPES